MELEKFGVQEMSNDEMKTSDGGVLWLAALAVGFLGNMLYDCISDPGTCIQGFKDGYNRQ